MNNFCYKHNEIESILIIIILYLQATEMGIILYVTIVFSFSNAPSIISKVPSCQEPREKSEG